MLSEQQLTSIHEIGMQLAQGSSSESIALTKEDASKLSDILLHLFLSLTNENPQFKAERFVAQRTLMDTHSVEAVRQRTSELSLLSGPFRTSDKRLAGLWEQEGFAPLGTTYALPSQTPGVNHGALRTTLHISSDREQRVRERTAELSRISRESAVYLTEKQMKEVLADPEKASRARALGILPPA